MGVAQLASSQNCSAMSWPDLYQPVVSRVLACQDGRRHPVMMQIDETVLYSVVTWEKSEQQPVLLPPAHYVGVVLDRANCSSSLCVCVCVCAVWPANDVSCCCCYFAMLCNVDECVHDSFIRRIVGWLNHDRRDCGGGGNARICSASNNIVSRAIISSCVSSVVACASMGVSVVVALVCNLQ